MFEKNKPNIAKDSVPESSSINIIGQGTKIVGEITCTGDIRIDGELKGNLISKGKLVVGPTGIIIGDISCKNSDVSGKIQGKMIISELLSLKATAKINGDIVTSKLAVEPGAYFTGTCNMDSNNQPSSEKRNEENVKK